MATMGVLVPGSISRMSSRTSSLWIQVRTVEDGVLDRLTA